MFNILFKLGRKTSDNSFIPEIDGLRFFAIITVLFFHLNTTLIRNVPGGFDGEILKDYYTDLGWWIIRLDLGVKVFFAISGFILALPFIKSYETQKPIDLKSYFIRRFTRLEPPFLISLLGLFFFQTIFLTEDISLLWPYFFASLLYMHGFIFGEPSKINPVTWSLETEFQFYLLMPLLMLLLFKNRHLFISVSGLILLSLLSYFTKAYIIDFEIKMVSFSILVHLGNFLTGILFALFYYKNPVFFKQKRLMYDFIGLLALFLLFNYYKPQAFIINSILFNISILFLFLAVFKGSVLNYVFTRKFIYTIGGMCYSIYLTHYALLFIAVPFTISLTNNMSYKLQLMIQSFIHIPIVLFVASAFFVLFERPFMDKNWPENIRHWLYLNFNKNNS